MNDTSTRPNGDVEGTLLGHVGDNGGGIASDAVFLLEELARPDGLLSIADGASHAVAMFEELVDDVHACRC